MTPQSETGPVLPPRGSIYRQANELAQLAQIARECATAGPRCDLQRAVRTLDQARAVLGPSFFGLQAPADASASLASGAGAPTAGRPCGPAGHGAGGIE